MVHGPGGVPVALLGGFEQTLAAGTEPEKSLGGAELNCCSIKAYFTLYCLHFRLGEAVVGLHGIRSGRGARAPPAPPLDPSLTGC